MQTKTERGKGNVKARRTKAIEELQVEQFAVSPLLDAAMSSPRSADGYAFPNRSH